MLKNKDLALIIKARGNKIAELLDFIIDERRSQGEIYLLTCTDHYEKIQSKLDRDFSIGIVFFIKRRSGKITKHVIFDHCKFDKYSILTKSQEWNEESKEFGREQNDSFRMSSLMLKDGFIISVTEDEQYTENQFILEHSEPT